ncbi:MAG: RagB/SusD family nutrient uptake outer membrane protein, partial [Prevotella sp.]|nr:RagB/SusD family nutrient uptake outer membrane protein [Prevotella sp.]
LSSNTTIGNIAELIRTYPNIAPDDNITSQCPYPLLNKSGYRTFEAWGIYFPTQDLVDQYLVTDAETGEALPWNETSQYKNNVENLDKGLITGKGSIDSYMRTNNDTRNMPTSQDFNDVKDGYEHFKLFAGLKPGATKNISQLMYENRDKRFYYSIIYDGCTWVGETVGLNLQGNLSQGVRDREDGGWYNTTTGYYWRKNTIESPEPRAYYSCKVNYHYNIARLGEAYMNLAEAYLLKKDIPAAVEALNKTRTIHGGLKASSATTEETAWKDYIRERTVEMTNEGGDLYFSYLRWGKYGGAANHGRQPGDVIYDLDRPVYKIEINRDRSKILVLQHTLNKSADRRFTTKRYLLPINQGFLDTREAYGLDHTQNPEW